MDTKTCAKCHEPKPTSEYRTYPRNKDGLYSYCKTCSNVARKEYYYRNQATEQKRSLKNYYDHRERYRDNDLIKQYGLTREARDQMYVDQAGCCAICDEALDNGKLTHVDHCHETGRVRGLLCHSCNRGIGYLKDDPGRCFAAWSYLAANDSGSLKESAQSIKEVVHQ